MTQQCESRLSVAILEPQPLVVEGIRSTLAASGSFELLEPARSLEALTRQIVAVAPRVVLVDKCVGVPPLLEWLSRMRSRNVAVVVWGPALSDAEALRFLKAGARGVLRKSAEPETLLACLDAVATGGTWMEDALFTQGARQDGVAHSDLTVREQEVLSLVEQGMRNKEIASELGIRPGTVKIHLKHIFEKTGVRGRFGLALSGMRERREYMHTLA